MRTTLLSLAFTAVFAFSTSCESGGEVSAEELGESTRRLESLPNDTAWAQGTRWSYEAGFAGFAHAWVYRPVGFSKSVPTMRGAVIHLVGCGELPYQVAQGTGWPQVAEDNGFVVVVPEITSPVYPNAAAKNVACFNYGLGSPLPTMPTRTSADHAAIIAAAKKLVIDLPDLKIDAHQIYLAGFSAGGAVAMQVACMAPDLFSGVGVVAGPAMGTSQSTAVMPPSITADKVKSQCTTYAKSGTLADPLATLAETTWVLVSDNNGLPAGTPVMVDGVWTAEKFRKQTIWDGDKFCPYLNHSLTSTGISALLKATKSGARAAMSFAGNGSGCAGGEASHDDTAETECTFAQTQSRAWVATAETWKNAAGQTRMVWINQDTLRHRWPTGPLGALDHEPTPNKQAMIDSGYYTSSGQFDDAKVAAAPNGALGALYFAPDSFNFAAYLAKTWTENNPRIAPVASPLKVTASASVSNGTKVTISGEVTPSAGVTGVTVKVNGMTKTATLTAGDPAQYSVDFTITQPGMSTATVTVSNGTTSASATASFVIVGSGDNKPVIDEAKAVVEGTLVKVIGKAHDDDNDLERIEMIVGVASSVCYGTTEFTCALDFNARPSVGPLKIKLIATDALGQSGEYEFTFDVPAESLPVIDTATATVSGSTLTVKGTAHDADGDLSRVEVVLPGSSAAVACSGTATFTCTISVSGLSAGEYVAKITAVDAAGNRVTNDTRFTIAERASCVTAKNSEHVAQGRAHMGSFYVTSAFANGTNTYLGSATSWSDPVTSLQEQTTAGNWALVSSCP